MKKLLIPGQAEKLYFQIPSRFLTIMVRKDVISVNLVATFLL